MQRVLRQERGGRAKIADHVAIGTEGSEPLLRRSCRGVLDQAAAAGMITPGRVLQLLWPTARIDMRGAAALMVPGACLSER
jgi:hypothetical protein